MLECQKHLFSLPEGLHYLNCAYMSPLLQAAEEEGVAGIRRKRDPSLITADDFFAVSDGVRARFARLVNVADPRRVAIVPAVSYAVAVAARNAPRGRGASVVVAGEQFPSNVHAWRRLCAEAGMELRTVAAPEEDEGRGRLWNERVLAAIGPGTAVVALPHVHWTDGTRFDLERIGERAREHGALFVVDGTQSVGALPFDVERIRPDLLVCAGYKWLLGPYGIGVAYFGERFDEAVPLEETWIGRAGSEDFRGLVGYRDEYQPGAARFDVGERSNFVLLPMLSAALDQLLEWDPARVQEYCAALVGELVAEMRERGFGVEDGSGRAAHLFGLRTPPGLDVDRLQTELSTRRVSVSLRGSAVRVSPHLYNDARDIAALREALLGAWRGSCG